jgi:hypothetical protein
LNIKLKERPIIFIYEFSPSAADIVLADNLKVIVFDGASISSLIEVSSKILHASSTSPKLQVND